MKNAEKLPLGVQSFEKLRKEKMVYVDKTAYVCRIAERGGCYFLSRPRKFGKSLLLSTIEACLQGRRELFEGLNIIKMGYGWRKMEVLRMDLGISVYGDVEDLDRVLDYYLSEWEEKYGIERSGRVAEIRFAEVIRRAYKESGKKVNVLVDEYDRPLICNRKGGDLYLRFKARLRGIYGVLKSMDGMIHVGMVVGVTKFGRRSVFSSLNNLHDISLLPQWGGICGFSGVEARELVKGSRLEWKDVEGMYGGYCFSRELENRMVNPYSLLSAIEGGELRGYWYESGTSSELGLMLADSNFRFLELERLSCSESSLGNVGFDDMDAIGLLYQSGYLTIKGYDRIRGRYRVGFPNKEVEDGFYESLMGVLRRGWGGYGEYSVYRFVDALERGNVREFMLLLETFLSGMPYLMVENTERYFHNVTYVLFKLMGLKAEIETRTSHGRSDMVVRAGGVVYIFEFKLDGSAKNALEQIERGEYWKPYMVSGERIVGVGVNFSSERRNVGEWQSKRFDKVD